MLKVACVQRSSQYSDQQLQADSVLFMPLDINIREGLLFICLFLRVGKKVDEI